jgi:hypothetical protein
MESDKILEVEQEYFDKCQRSTLLFAGIGRHKINHFL